MRLAPKPRRILRCASVLGQSFRDETLQLLLEGDGIDPGDTLTEDLAPFLEPDGEGRWRFRQALTRDVAYEVWPSVVAASSTGRPVS